jgi:hypothetical protein
MHKNERELDERGRTWKLSWEAMRATGRFQTWYWMNNKWPNATRTMRWFYDHFIKATGICPGGLRIGKRISADTKPSTLGSA